MLQNTAVLIDKVPLATANALPLSERMPWKDVSVWFALVVQTLRLLATAWTVVFHLEPLNLVANKFKKADGCRCCGGVSGQSAAQPTG